jgi:hypothetical protein
MVESQGNRGSINVRSWHLADIGADFERVRYSG